MAKSVRFGKETFRGKININLKIALWHQLIRI